MTLDMNEKRALFAFGCPNHESTLKWLQMLSALATDPYAKRFFRTLKEKLAEGEHWYRCYYYHMCMEVEQYYIDEYKKNRIRRGALGGSCHEADKV